MEKLYGEFVRCIIITFKSSEVPKYGQTSFRGTVNSVQTATVIKL